MEQQPDAPTDPEASDLPSCEGCRKRKLKCSRRLPLCSNCERLDIQCVYDGRKNKPGLRSGAIDGLNRRLDHIENYLFVRGQGRDHDSGSSSEPPGRDDLLSRHLNRPENSADTERPVLDALSSLTRVIQDLGSAITSTRPASDARDDVRADAFTNGHVREEERQTERPPKRRRTGEHVHCASQLADGNSESDDLFDSFSEPAQSERLERLLYAFCDRVQPWFPIFHIARFPEQARDPSQRRRLAIILHAIQVAALRFITDEDGGQYSPDHVAREVKRSRDHVILKAMSGLSVENLQALAVVAFTDIGNGESHKAWPLIASLTRTVDYLRLTVEPDECKERGGLLRPLPNLPPPRDFIEEEERRRVFWNIFNLDRFCSVTTGWNTSLTATDVSRRLPVCGGIWWAGKAAPTPYFGIWGRSAARIGNSITFLPAHYPSPSHSAAANDAVDVSTPGQQHARAAAATQPAIDMSNVGAFAYNIESLESLSRITTYFLHQEVDLKDREQLTAWLTRFKELDLRLVHWKMFLPQQWQDSGMSRETMPGVMDPNMTNAHTTHNTSMILLHQRIAYPTAELGTTKLPSLYSAETCRSAAIEIANITRSYIDKWSPHTIVSPQMAFAAFVGGRVLLVHSSFYKSELAPEFWTLVRSLEEMHERWIGRLRGHQDAAEATSLFKQFALRLRGIHARYIRDPGLTIDVSGQFDDTAWEEQLEGEELLAQGDVPRGTGRDAVRPGSVEVLREPPRPGAPALSARPSSVREQNGDYGWAGGTAVGEGMGMEADELSAISQVLMDQQFMDMDRVISFEDVMCAPGGAGGASHQSAMGGWVGHGGVAPNGESAYWKSR